MTVIQSDRINENTSLLHRIHPNIVYCNIKNPLLFTSIFVTTILFIIIDIIFIQASHQYYYHNHQQDDQKPSSVQVLYTKDASQNLKSINHHYPPLPMAGQSSCRGIVLLLRHCEVDSYKGIYDDKCNLVGSQRAEYLSDLFVTGNNSARNIGVDERNDISQSHGNLHLNLIEPKWSHPTALYVLDTEATKTGTFMDTKNFLTLQRAYETLEPLSKMSGIDITSFHSRQELLLKLMNDLQSGFICHDFGHDQSTKDGQQNQDSNVDTGGVLVIAVADYRDILNLGIDLGCGPLNAGCPDSYNFLEYDLVWELTFAVSTNKIHNDDDHHESDETMSGPEWRVFGTVTRQDFDPLAYSKLMGLYDNDSNHY